MELARPSWALARDGERPPKQQRTAEVVQEARNAAGKGAGRQDVERELVKILAKLVLSNSDEIRSLTSVVYQTWLLPQESELVKAMRQAGEDYHQQSQVLKERKKSDESVDLGSLGSPHLHIWTALVEAMHKQATGEDKVAINRYWTEVVLKSKLEDLNADVRLLRCRVPRPLEQRKRAGVEQKARVQWCLDVSRSHQAGVLEEILGRMFKSEGGERKAGPAPRGSLERDAKALLQKLGNA